EGVPARDHHRAGARDGWRRRPPRPRGGARRLPLAARAATGGRRMLSEEAVLLLACLAVTALVIIALLEVVWPSRVRHPRAGARYRRPHATRSRDARPAHPRTPTEARQAPPPS